jgi:26S proteasome regulatory subunit N2
LFDVAESSDYVQTILARCLDTYISSRVRAAEEGNEDNDGIDPRLTAVVERLFDRCVTDGQAEQAVGIALETRRLDRLESAISGSSDPVQTLVYALDVTQKLVVSRSFRDRVMRLVVAHYGKVPQPDNAAICKCLTFLGDVDEVAAVLIRLLNGTEDDALLAYQIGFDLVEAELQAFIAQVREKLKAAAPAPVKVEAPTPAAANEDVAMEEGGDGEAAPLLAPEAAAPAPTAAETTVVVDPLTEKFNRFDSIVSGDVPIELERQFLASRNASDLQILKNIKAGIEPRNSVCHGATVFANAVAHAGTGVDTFLRDNLDWLAKATNWAKFSATAGLGVIHRGALTKSKALVSPYLPSAPGGSSPSPYSEGGALYALGLMHINHGHDVRQLLLESLRGTQQEVVQHGACLGLGISGLGSEDVEAFEDVKNVLYMDSAVAGEGAGLALGLLFAGTGTDRAAEMLAYAHDTQHEKIIRGLSLGLAVISYGREDEAETMIESMTRDQDPIIRYGGMFTIGLAYRGTGNNGAIQKLLHFAVSDVSDDVRRAAVMNLGFVLAAAPEQCPRIVALLAESYNPHVRYGAAMAVGIAAAGTGLRDAVSLLEPMLRDSVDFVQQGALVAMSLVMMEQPESRQKALRERISSLHGNRGAETMARMGAIMAAGILDAGGRNATIGMRSNSGTFRRTSVIGMALFVQYWYWHPMSYTISLALAPTALIGVDATLAAPKDFTARCDCKPSMFAYPAPVPTEDKKSKEKMPTAVLSTTARFKARAAKKATAKDGKKTGGGDAMETDDAAAGGAGPSKEGEAAEGEGAAAAETAKVKEPEPTSFTLENPARVVPQQRRFVAFVSENRWHPVRPTPSGFVVLKNSTPDEPVEYLFQEEKKPAATEAATAPAATGDAATQPTAAGAADAGDEPPPPEPFEYVPS